VLPRQLLIGLSLTVGTIVLGVVVIDWGKTLDEIQKLTLGPVLLAMSLVVAALLLFAVRWRLLLATKQRLPFMRIFNCMMIGYCVNALLPARPGDVARIYLLRREGWMRLSSGMASIVLEKLFDILTISIIATGVSLAVRLPGIIETGIYITALSALGLLVSLIFVHRCRLLISGLPSRFPYLFGGKVAQFVIDRLFHFSDALSVLYVWRRTLAVSVISALGWALLGGYLWMLLEVFKIDVPISAAFFVLAVTNMGAAIPSSPGALGIFHFLTILALATWQIDKATALAFAIVAHGLAIFLHISLGLLASWMEGIRVFRLSKLLAQERGASV